MLVERFEYIALSRKNIDGSRKYLTPDGERLASVTTVLDRTKPEADRLALENWKKAVGEQKAQEICTEAAGRGTRMHKYLEDYILDGELRVPGTNPYAKQANKMAGIIIEKGMSQCDEIWGTEVPVYYPGLFAGTTDCVGLFNGEETIIDFKQSNKVKDESRVQDYYVQLIMYATAHNELHGTNIRQGVILMCTKDFQYLEFVLAGEKWDKHEKKMWKRLEEYYEM